jgi:hypothetical protein
MQLVKGGENERPCALMAVNDVEVSALVQHALRMDKTDRINRIVQDFRSWGEALTI